jgi:hypothetical protein
MLRAASGHAAAAPPRGITYLNTFFVKHTRVRDEELYFHELIHVIQWRTASELSSPDAPPSYILQERT